MPSAAPSLFIIFNPASGSDDTDEVRRRVADRLQAAGRPFELFVAGPGDELAAVIGRAVNAARDARGAVVAAGGDGTLNAVAQAVWNANLPMGVLPRGTFNYFARAHGMPAELDEAIDTLLNAHIEPVTVGLVGERLFLVNASVGLYPRLLQEREQANRRLGRSRIVAMLAGLATLLRGRSVMTLELHGHGQARVVRTRTLFVGHNELQLRAIGLREALAVESGRLAAITLQPLPAWRTLWLLVRGALGRLDGAEGVDSFAFDRLVVQPWRAGAHVKAAVDGEIVRLRAPLVFQTAPRPLRLLVPRPPEPEAGA
ncbi:MAG: diacylglycerol kinase family protein [Pseudomonadota bacterium]|nr:diacylglycerol kinase family protein [Pseudomonadota bacterium]